MKKIIIFSASTGGGHNQVAVSLQNEFKEKGYEALKFDILKETSTLLDILIADGYKVLANSLPKMYGGLYKISDRKRVNRGITSIFTKLSSRKIYEIIKENNPKLIIGTHPFIVNVIGKLKKDKRIDIPFITVVTDYKAHQTYINENVDAYVTGSYYTSLGLINKGVKEGKIYTYGIPIRREFLANMHLDIKKDEDYFTVLLMGGSMGVKSIKKVLKRIVNNRYKIRIIIVCGKNEILKKSIEKKYKNDYINKKIIVYGFTNNIPQLMEESDVIITKPGGLTVAESIVKKLPMIIPFFIPGQEEENADFLVKTKAAIRVDDVDEINNVINYLINQPEELDEMIDRMKELSNVYSLENIIQLGDELINQHKYEWGIAYE